VNRQAQAVVMLLLGGAVLRASLTDMYLRYVKEGLRPFLIAAGAVLVATAVMTLWYELRSPRDQSPRDQSPRDQSPRDHEHREPRVGWLLVLPVLGLLLVAPPALGSYAAGQAGTALSGQRASDFPPLPAGDPARVGVLDYASRAVFDQGRSLAGRRVELTGFLADGPDGAPYLARMVLACCAADARPIKVGLTGAGPGPGELSADTWIEVVGKYTDQTASDPVNGETIPYLDVESWQQVPTPKQQYE
jgi:uncharacterized repeat protein (TIGR03943 family)